MSLSMKRPTTLMLIALALPPRGSRARAAPPPPLLDASPTRDSESASVSPSSLAASPLSSVAAPDSASAQSPSVLTGVPYASASPSQTLDLYLPAADGGRRPPCRC